MNEKLWNSIRKTLGLALEDEYIINLHDRAGHVYCKYDTISKRVLDQENYLVKVLAENTLRGLWEHIWKDTELLLYPEARCLIICVPQCTLEGVQLGIRVKAIDNSLIISPLLLQPDQKLGIPFPFALDGVFRITDKSVWMINNLWLLTLHQWRNDFPRMVGYLQEGYYAADKWQWIAYEGLHNIKRFNAIYKYLSTLKQKHYTSLGNKIWM